MSHRAALLARLDEMHVPLAVGEVRGRYSVSYALPNPKSDDGHRLSELRPRRSSRGPNLTVVSRQRP